MGVFMKKIILSSVAMALAMALAAPTAATAQGATINQSLAGTRLDISATGEVTRVPDLAIISAGVQTLQPTATAAIEENATRMERVRAALKRAGIADKDIKPRRSASLRIPLCRKTRPPCCRLPREQHGKGKVSDPSAWCILDAWEGGGQSVNGRA